MDDYLYGNVEQIKGFAPLGPPDETENPTQSAPAWSFYEQMAKYYHQLHFDSERDADFFPQTPCKDYLSNGHGLGSLLTTDSRFIYGDTSPFLSELPLNSGTTPSTSLQRPSTPPMWIDRLGFIELAPSAAPSSYLPEHLLGASLSTEAKGQPAHQDFPLSSKKRKRLQSDLQVSSASNLYTGSSSDAPRSRSESSHHEDDESDSGSVYRPSPGPSTPTPKKRTRLTRSTKHFGKKGDSGDKPTVVANGSKKIRGRKVAVAPEFREGGQIVATPHKVLPFTSHGVKMEGGAERPYICTEEGCGKNFQRGEHLKRHVNSVHLKYRRYECPHEGCTSTFSRKDNMKQHGRVSHGLPPVAMEMSNGSFSGS